MKRSHLLLAGTLVVAAILFVSVSIKRVSTGEQAVVVRGGRVTRLLTTGLHFVSPLSGQLTVYPAGVVERRIPVDGSFRVRSANGQTLAVAVNATFTMALGAAPAMYKIFGSDLDEGVTAAFRDAVEIQAAQHVAMGGHFGDDFKDALLQDVSVALGPGGITVQTMVIVMGTAGGVSFPVEPEPPRKVIVLGVDGGDWDVIRPMVATGQLPNFARLINDGATGVLQSMKPMLSPLLWTTMATGRLPEEHGILNFTITEPETGKTVPITRLSRKVDAFWSILGDHGRSVDVVGWLATFPAEDINGVMVTDRVGYIAYADATDGEELPGSIAPAARADEISELVVDWQSIAFDRMQPFLNIDADVFQSSRAAGFDHTNPINNMIMLFASTETYRRIGTHLLETNEPDVLAVYFELVDATKHLFMHCAPPPLDWVDAAEQRKFSTAVEQAYILQDEIIGDFMNRMDDETVLMVVSDHGFKSGENRPRQRPEIWAGKAAFWHELGGIICVYGNGVRAGHTIADASIKDVTPTLLALQGLPAPDDMAGRVLEEIFEVDLQNRFNGARVATLNRAREDDPSAFVAADAASDEVMKKLAALGYINPESEAGNADAHNNLGQRYQENGQLEEAVAEFKKALEIRPSFPAALNNIGVCYGRMRRFAEAEKSFAQALEYNPEDVYAMNNLAIMHMQLGRFDDAISWGNRAIRIEPNYANAHLTLGSVYANMGELKDAEGHFERAVEIDPSNATARSYLERVRAGLKEQ